MAIDRFVYFKHRKGPKIQDLKTVLEDYLGSAGIYVEFAVHDKDCRIMAMLPGKPNFPFKRIKGYEDMGRPCECHQERWFEVYWHSSRKIDVITRQTDEFTNVVAQGFAELCARFWKGEVERDE